MQSQTGPAVKYINKTQVTRTTHEPPHNGTHERNTRPNHLAAISGCATTVRATSHAWVGGRAEVSMGSRVEVRRALARARVRCAPAGPSRLCSRDSLSDALSYYRTSVRAIRHGDPCRYLRGPPPVSIHPVVGHARAPG